LTIAPDEAMAQQARLLMERVESESTGTLAKNEIIEVITTIAVYKFSQLSREEVEAMLYHFTLWLRHLDPPNPPYKGGLGEVACIKLFGKWY
jgi:predicted transposase YdaD